MAPAGSNFLNATSFYIIIEVKLADALTDVSYPLEFLQRESRLVFVVSIACLL